MRFFGFLFIVLFSLTTFANDSEKLNEKAKTLLSNSLDQEFEDFLHEQPTRTVEELFEMQKDLNKTAEFTEDETTCEENLKKVLECKKTIKNEHDDGSASLILMYFDIKNDQIQNARYHFFR